MKTAVESQDREFLSRLQKQKQATVSDLCEALGVTANAVRQKLNRLQAYGFVDRKAVQVSRGRPHHVYYVTESGKEQLGDNYGDLALILWRELLKIENQQVRESVVESLRQSLVNTYGENVSAPTPAERLAELKKVLVEKGFDVEVDLEQELPLLREHNCPYLELARNDSSICELEQAVFGEILGANLTLKQCCLDGDHCCEFQVEALSDLRN